MLRLTIDAVNADELYQHIRELNGMLPEVEPLPCVGNEPVSCAECHNPDEHSHVHEPVETAQEPPKGELKEEPNPDPESSQEAQDEPQGPTAEEVRAALNSLRKIKGYDAVKKILTAHGSDNFPGLDKTHYAAVLKEAEADAAD